jgi:subtilisin family serine protease
VVTVASTTATRAESSFSNYGLGVIDVAAPGSSIWSTTIGSTYGLKSGTSMASPHVAGVAALLASTHPDASPAQLLALLRTQAQDRPCSAPIVLTGRPTQVCTGTTADNSFYGDGIADALAAVTAP